MPSEWIIVTVISTLKFLACLLLSSSFRTYALQAMQNLLDNMSDRDVSSPNSLFSSASEFTTPRDNVAPPSTGPTSLQTTPASFSNRPVAPSVTAAEQMATAEVGHFDSPWSNASSVTSSFRKLPPGGVQTKHRTERVEHNRLEASRVDSATSTPEVQSVGDSCQQDNLYFESPSRKSRERLESAQFENESADGEGPSSKREASNQNHKAVNGHSKALKRNEGDLGFPDDNTERERGKHYETPYSSSSSSRKDAMVVSSLATERTAPRRVSEKSRAAQEASALRPRSDAVFVMTRAASTSSVRRPATVAMATNNGDSAQDAPVVGDGSESSTCVGMVTKSKNMDDENGEYVYTSLSQRLIATTESQATGQLSTLKSWSVSDLTRSTGHFIQKPTAVSSSQMASTVSHGHMATLSSRPLATSSLSNISSLSSPGVQKAATKSPLSYSNFSLSATSHKPAAVLSLSHVPFATPPVSHTSASSHMALASFSQASPSTQDQTTARTVFNSRGELRDLANGVSPRVSPAESGSRRHAANIGLSGVGSNKPVIMQPSLQALGRETRK